MAIDKLKELPIEELAMFIPQLTQILKFERNNVLLDYLLGVAVANYDVFGWEFFWCVRNEMRHSFGYYH